MKQDIEKLIWKLRLDNEMRGRKMNEVGSQYNYRVLVHQYNLTIEFINSLGAILEVHCD